MDTRGLSRGVGESRRLKQGGETGRLSALLC